jgi:hypothetical protein
MRKQKEMVRYWKTQDSVEAKVYVAKEGHTEMQMKGEKYPFPGHPRGTLLFGKLSPLKHWIKNKVFNDVWAMLDERTTDEIINYLKTEAYPYIFDLGEKCKYDIVPFERLVPPMKELHRALTEAGFSDKWRDIIVFIFQEDDAYRMRFQWMVKFFPKFRKPNLQDLDKALAMLEHGEVISDMKERQRLIRRVLMVILKDPEHRAKWERFLKVANFKKLGLTKADKYFFRAKHFKVDYPEYQY